MYIKKQMLTPARPIYWVYGDEPFFVTRAIDRVRSHFRAAAYTVEVFDVDASFDWSVLETLSNSLSLFSSQRLLEFRLHSAKLPPEAAKALVAYLQSPPDDVVLLLWTQGYEANISKAKWFQSVQSKGIVIAGRRLTPTAFERWLQEAVSHYKLNLSPEAFRAFLSATEGNCLAASQLLSQLALLYPDKKVEAEQLDAILSVSTQTDTFAVIETAFEGNTSDLLRRLAALQANIVPLAFLGALLYQLSCAEKLYAALEQGLTFGAACQKAGIWRTKQVAFQAFHRRHDANDLARYFQHCAILERRFKGEASAYAWDHLTDLLLALAGESTLLSCWGEP